MPAPRRLEGRIALVTGASRGLGRAVALAYAAEGAHVVISARTKGGLEELDDEIRAAGGAATILPLNLAHGDKIDALGPTLFQRWGRLDVLVGNAAMLGPLSPLGHVSAEDWQRVMTVNVEANWRLLRTLDPLLRRSDAGRAIFVSSGAARSCRAYWGPYSVSKAALEALVKTYAHEAASSAVKANLIDPGLVRTAMRATAMPGEDPMTLPEPSALGGVFVALAEPGLVISGEVVKAVDHPEYRRKA